MWQRVTESVKECVQLRKSYGQKDSDEERELIYYLFLAVPGSSSVKPLPTQSDGIVAKSVKYSAYHCPHHPAVANTSTQEAKSSILRMFNSDLGCWSLY
jgi:hypothetical protein